MSWKDKIRTKAQGMVEFALILPILLFLVVGIIELGRLLFIYSSVSTAAREGTRYGSASGDITYGAGTIKQYQDCAGIKNAIQKANFGGGITDDINHMVIGLIKPPSASNPNDNFAQPYISCAPGSAPIVDLSGFTDGDRIYIRVCADYEPVVPLFPDFARKCAAGTGIRAISRRTIMGVVSLSSSNYPTSTSTRTATFTRTSTSSPTNTYTFTPSKTPTRTPTLARTYTPSKTPTITDTLTPTLSPTNTLTPTPKYSCYTTYQVEEDYIGLFSGKIVLRNNVANITDDWNLKFKFPSGQKIQSISSTGYTYTQSGRDVTITSSNDINTGDSVEIRFLADYKGTNIYPFSFYMNGSPCEIPPLPSSGQCDVRHGPLTTSPFQVTIYNNSSYAVVISRIVVAWNDNPASTQALKTLTLGGTQIFSGTSSSPPTNLTSADLVTGIANANITISSEASKTLVVTFNNTYVTSSLEYINITFDDNDCLILSSSNDALSQ
jgi:hypothetical protein